MGFFKSVKKVDIFFDLSPSPSLSSTPTLLIILFDNFQIIREAIRLILTIKKNLAILLKC